MEMGACGYDSGGTAHWSQSSSSMKPSHGGHPRKDSLHCRHNLTSPVLLRVIPQPYPRHLAEQPFPVTGDDSQFE
jgi:hypothetical protein